MPRRILMSTRVAAWCVCVLLVSMIAGSAQAHRQKSDLDSSGLEIPALTHGQMAVVADYRGEILDLAARQNRTDETFRRLLNFANLQYAACFWGLMPGSIGNETSPFNECSHAYLSAMHAALMHLREMSADKPVVEALISRIDADMMRNRASFVMCQFSGETFSTASLVMPDWWNILWHLPSLIAVGTIFLAAMAGLLAVLLPIRTCRYWSVWSSMPWQ
ncbi:hypothetical protein P3C58_21465 [Mesorhizobium sp. XAP10]|uniref:hypothetical protein n=1 Tax=unclassified Mesorhizobium TaxID=325217 RepID=UPI0023E02D78|nr:MULTISPECIES: hypothetical protein [unclassified Mesorhizobium]MDF3154552.1 hypothetical protein [Mesorhizobium sp. XAP10]MDF3247898.1 hypothetical protein [Mesorhizobium sp. XAP4]